MRNSHFYALNIFKSPFFQAVLIFLKAHGKKMARKFGGGRNSFTLHKIVGLFYLHFSYMHESRKKIKGESAVPTDPAWLYPPPSIITSSQLGADCSLAAFKQLHSTQLSESWFPASLRVFTFYCPPWSEDSCRCCNNL